MFRSTLFLSCLCAALGASACRRAKPSRPPSPPAAKKDSPTPTPPAPPTPPAEAAAEDSHRRWELTVKAGSLAREDVIVSTILPGIPPAKSVLVREPGGGRVPSQMRADGQVAFRVKAMKAGSQAIYLAEEGGAASGKGGVLAVRVPEGVKLTVDGLPILTYQTQRSQVRKEVAPVYARNGYIHPLYSPAGVMVTDDYPKDKPYQHGIWSGWQKVEFGNSHPDFWDTSLQKGRVAVESVAPLWVGPLLGGFGSHQFFTDMDGRIGSTALREGWSVTAFRDSRRAPYFVVDLESRQEVLNGQITLGQNQFGGITMRGSRDWQGGGKSIFLTSQGQDRGKAQGAPAHWCYLGGKSGGKLAGVAILAHPQNTREPEAVFVDQEAPVVGFAPTRNGPIPLSSGRPLSLKYRFVVLDGKPDSKLFDRLWNDFVDPPAVEVRFLAGR